MKPPRGPKMNPLITLCRVCNLAIYELPGWGRKDWSHFETMDHRAEPKKWMREDW